MADTITGTINGTTTNSSIKSKIDWYETANIPANTGTVTATLYLRTYLSYETYSHGSDFTLTVNGSTKTVDNSDIFLRDEYGWVKCISHTVSNIAHNVDGSKQIAISCTGFMAGTSVTAVSCAATVSLYAIPRASTFAINTSSVSVDGTNAVSAAITSKSSAYTHRVRVYVGANYDAATYKNSQDGIGTSYSYVIPTSWRMSMPTTTSTTATMEVTTFNGATQVGDPATGTFTIAVPESVHPILDTSNVVIAPVQSSATAGFAPYIQGYTACGATFAESASAYQSEVDIATRYIRIELDTSEETGASGENPLFCSTDYIQTSGKYNVTVGVTDTRGRVGERTEKITVLPYALPTLSSTNVFRCNSAGVAADDGGYVSIFADATYLPCGGYNSAILRAYYKAASASTYGDAEVFTENVVSKIGGGTLSSTVTYDVKLTITDTIGNSHEYIFKIPTASVAFNIREGGKGGAFGKFAEVDDLLESAWNIKAPGATFTGAPSTRFVDARYESYDEENGILATTGASGSGLGGAFTVFRMSGGSPTEFKRLFIAPDYNIAESLQFIDGMNGIFTRVLHTANTQCGTVPAAAITPGAYRDISVTFTHALPTGSYPSVILTLVDPYPAVIAYGLVQAVVTGITATGFTARIVNNSGYDVSPALNWFAMLP